VRSHKVVSVFYATVCISLSVCHTDMLTAVHCIVIVEMDNQDCGWEYHCILLLWSYRIYRWKFEL